MNDYEAALYREISGLSISVDECTLTTVMNCYCCLNGVEYGFAMLGLMLKGGYRPDDITYSTLVRALYREHRVLEGVELYEKLIYEEEFDWELDSHRFLRSMFKNGLCKSGNAKVAIGFVRVMGQGRFKEEIVDYSTVIDGLCKEGLLDDALNFLRK
ncbi:hypothetical protein AgCh_013796 [Apium graveolens]